MPSVRYFSNSIGNFDERERETERGGWLLILFLLMEQDISRCITNVKTNLGRC